MKKKRIINLVYMAPFLLSILILGYLPVIVSIPQSFRVLDASSSPAVLKWGFDNYKLLLTDNMFWKSFLNTIEFILIGFLTFPIPLFVAILLNNVIKGQMIYRVIYYLPALTSIVIVITVMRMLFATSDAGLANKLISILGMEPVDWIRNPWINKFTVTIMNLWNAMGSNCILYLAGLQVISFHLYEAAEIDGANAFKKMLYITLPGVRNTVYFMLYMFIIAGFQNFANVYILSGNGWSIDKNLQTVMMFIFMKMFTRSDMPVPGMALAGSIMLGILVFSVVLIMNRYTRISGSENTID